MDNIENLGFVKLYREYMYSSVFCDPDLWRLYTWCMMKAAHAEHEIILNKCPVTLMAGQFVYGRYRAAEALNEKPSTVHRWMHKLEELGFIGIKSTNQYSIVTVTHWYMQTEEPKTNSRRTAKRQQKGTNKNVDNVNNVNSGNAKLFEEDFKKLL